MRSMRAHHRGYFFVWDLLELWRAATRHVVP
jgi:hypothetical protein